MARSRYLCYICASQRHWRDLIAHLSQQCPASCKQRHMSTSAQCHGKGADALASSTIETAFRHLTVRQKVSRKSD
eukprot:6189692-Pleurochrysis_carterae.AAC.3